MNDLGGIRIVTAEEKELYAQVDAEMKRAMAASVDQLVEHLPQEQKAAIQSLSPEQRRAFGRAFAEEMARFRGWREVSNVNETDVEVVEELEGLGPVLEIDKAWHGLHFLLCGLPEGGDPPFGLAVLGGTALGDDLGYGPARYLIPTEVRDVATALAEVEADALAARFSAKALQDAEVYPGGWESDDCLAWLLDAYQSLRTFYQDAAERGNAALLYLT